MTATEKMIWFVIAPLLLIIVASSFMFVFVDYELAWWLSLIGTPVVLLANLINVIFFDSKKRWPGLTARERAVKVMTFQR